MTAKPRQRIRHHGADEYGDEHGRGHAEPGAQLQVDEQDGGDVGADREEHLRAEVELACPVADDVPADAEHRVDQDQKTDRLVEGETAELEKNRIDDGQDEPGDEDYPRSGQRDPEVGAAL